MFSAIELGAMLRELLWLAAWQAGKGPRDRTLVRHHERFLRDLIAAVQRHYDETEMRKAARSPVRTRDGDLLLIDEGIRDVLERCKRGSSISPQDAVLQVKTWLDTWCSMSGRPHVDQVALETEMRAAGGMDAIAAWKANCRGPGEASAALIQRFGGVGRTRLTDLRTAVSDEERVDLVRHRYRVGVRPDALKQFAMELVGFSPAAIKAAMAVQPHPIEVDFYFGQWLG